MLDWEAPSLCRTTNVDGDGFIEIQPAYFGAPDGVDGGPGGGPGMRTLFPSGFLSRPRDPDVDLDGTPSDGASCVYFYYGDQGYALPTFDARLVSVLPQVSKGGALLFADVGNLRVSTIAMSGDDGDVDITVPTGAAIRLLAPSGRNAIVSATGVDIVGITNAGVVSADDPGVAPSPVAIAGPIASFIATLETWAEQADLWMAAAQLTTGVPISPAFIAAIAARVAAASTIAGVYPGGMTSTRLNSR